MVCAPDPQSANSYTMESKVQRWKSGGPNYLPLLSSFALFATDFQVKELKFDTRSLIDFVVFSETIEDGRIKMVSRAL